METQPKFKLSRLREIGWRCWDPIGLSREESRPDDEYDSYLMVAAGRLWNGASDDEVMAYIVRVETEHMGLGDVPGVRARARETVHALREYVTRLRG
jgi:hypothetical protein